MAIYRNTGNSGTRFWSWKLILLPVHVALIGLIVLAGCSRHTQNENDSKKQASWDREAREQLMDMISQDQNIRKKLNKETMKDPGFMKKWTNIDSLNSICFKNLVDSLGWPGIDEVGTDGLEAAFLLVQHSRDLKFQERMLPVIEKDVKKGSLNPYDYALLADRVRVNSGRPQLYGTQLSMIMGTNKAKLDPMVDSSRVNARRRELGLRDLDWYLEQVEDQTDFDVIGFDSEHAGDGN